MLTLIAEKLATLRSASYSHTIIIVTICILFINYETKIAERHPTAFMYVIITTLTWNDDSCATIWCWSNQCNLYSRAEQLELDTTVYTYNTRIQVQCTLLSPALIKYNCKYTMSAGCYRICTNSTHERTKSLDEMWTIFLSGLMFVTWLIDVAEMYRSDRLLYFLLNRLFRNRCTLECFIAINLNLIKTLVWYYYLADIG